MITEVNRFCDKLQGRLDSAEERLKVMKSNIQTLPEQADKAVREKLDEVRRKLHGQQERMEQAQANLKARVQQKMTETKEVISEWRAKREARKLEDRANRAETYAADAIDYALIMIDVAEEAIFDAVVARIDADAAYERVPAAR